MKDASIPIPQTIKITLRFFFCGVISPECFVNKNNELYASKPKNANAEILWTQLLISTGTWNVPVGSLYPQQGNKQMQSPNRPAKLQMIASCLSYPS